VGALGDVPPFWRPTPSTGKRLPAVLPRDLEALAGHQAEHQGDGWPTYLVMPPGGGLVDACGFWRSGISPANDSRA
jgi:hypothetical protein